LYWHYITSPEASLAGQSYAIPNVVLASRHVTTDIDFSKQLRAYLPVPYAGGAKKLKRVNTLPGGLRLIWNTKNLEQNLRKTAITFCKNIEFKF
jgi:hypothetical protein